MKGSVRNEFASERVLPIVTSDSSVEANRVADLVAKASGDSFHSDGDKRSPPAQIVRNQAHFDDIHWKYLDIYHSRNTHESVAEERNPQQCALDNVVQANKICTNGSGCRNDLAAVIKFCLGMDEKLVDMWKLWPKHHMLASTFLLSHLIQERLSQLASTNVESSDVAVAAFMCIGNEAHLMCEMLRLEAVPSDINRSDRIRMFALNLINYRGCGSVTAAAAASAMMGMAEAAKLMSEWMSKEKKLIVSCDPQVPQEIRKCCETREAAFNLIVTIVKHAISSAAIHTPGHKPEDMQSASKISSDVIWNATAVAGASKSSWASGEKLNYEDLQGRKQDEKRNKEKRKNSEIKIGVVLSTEEGVMKNSDKANRIVDDDKKWVEMWANNYSDDDLRSPPLQIVKYDDLIEKTWGWKRLVPVPLPSLGEMPFYLEYLMKYYKRNSVGAEKTIQDWLLKHGADQIANNGSGCENQLSVAANCCIKMEDQLMSVLNTQSEHMPNTIVLSQMIKERAHLLISRKDDFSEVAMAAFVCIGKEAELMHKMLELNAGPCDICLSDLIRMCALSLMNYRGRRSFAAAGVMVGIANEAKVMCEWLRENDELIVYSDPSLPQDIFSGKIIRKTAFDLMVRLVEDSSSCPANLPVLPDRVQSTIEISCDSNGAGNAVAEKAKFMWAKADKLKEEDHSKGKEKRNKNNNKNSKKKIRKFQIQTRCRKYIGKKPSRSTSLKASSIEGSLM